MSHFAVMVIMPDGTTMNNFDKRLVKILAPYQENNMGDCPRKYMEFEDNEDEWRKDYEEGTQERVVMEDGRLLLTWDKEFERSPTEKEIEEDPMRKLSKIKDVPKHLVKRQVPHKDLYETFELYVKEWHGQRHRDPETKRYGYWHNPNTKWDWWEVGGRWSGYFTLKGRKTGLKGKQYGYGQLTESRRPDICFMRDIDWETMRRQAEEAAGKEFDKVHEKIKGLPKTTPWETILEKYKGDGASIEAARDEYWSQPAAAAFKKLPYELVGFMGSVEKYQVTRKKFLQRARNGAGVSYAVIKDGKWYQRGEMGWWGMASDEIDKDDWDAQFAKLIDGLPEDTILTVVDCHI
jgi:hypothetical protein